jgi:hypothetical protein
MEEHESEILAQAVAKALKPAFVALIATVMREFDADRSHDSAEEIPKLSDFLERAEQRIQTAGMARRRSK